MAQRTDGVWRIFSNPKIYQLVMDFLGKNSRAEFAEKYIRAKPGDIVVDVGCGTGEIVNYFPKGVVYLGVDLSQEYINMAKKKWGDKGDFFCGDVTDFNYKKLGSPDIILAKGLLHHLGDIESKVLLGKLSKLIKNSGRVVTFDPCYTEKQNIFAKMVIKKDRGMNVRTPEQYLSLGRHFFSTISHEVRIDLLRIPYSHCIVELSKPR